MGIGPRSTPPVDDDNSAFGDLILDPSQFLSYQAWLATVPPSSFAYATTTIEHNNVGANCNISNDLSHFGSFKSSFLPVMQLDGSTATGQEIGLKIIQCPSSKHRLGLWPCY